MMWVLDFEGRKCCEVERDREKGSLTEDMGELKFKWVERGISLRS